MYLDGSDATLRGCDFESNWAEGSDLFGQLASFGGGMATRGSSVVTKIRSDAEFYTCLCPRRSGWVVLYMLMLHIRYAVVDRLVAR